MDSMDTAINARMGAELLVESCAFSAVEKPVESADSKTDGFATLDDVDLGEGADTTEDSSLTSGDIPYDYELLGSSAVKDTIPSTAGQTLSF